MNEKVKHTLQPARVLTRGNAFLGFGQVYFSGTPHIKSILSAKQFLGKTDASCLRTRRASGSVPRALRAGRSWHYCWERSCSGLLSSRWGWEWETEAGQELTVSFWTDSPQSCTAVCADCREERRECMAGAGATFFGGKAATDTIILESNHSRNIKRSFWAASSGKAEILWLTSESRCSSKSCLTWEWFWWQIATHTHNYMYNDIPAW